MVSLRGMSGLLTVRVFLSFFHSETASESSSIFCIGVENAMCPSLRVDEDGGKMQAND